MRPSWDEYFMEIAEVVKKRSTCIRRQVGAVIVRDKQILTTGYNGSPRNLEHCENIGCKRQELNIPSGERHELCRALHAEQNAIIQAAHNGISVDGATLYVTTRPLCFVCKNVHKCRYIENCLWRWLSRWYVYRIIKRSRNRTHKILVDKIYMTINVKLWHWNTMVSND